MTNLLETPAGSAVPAATAAPAEPQVAPLEGKATRLQKMVIAADARRAHLRAYLVELEGRPAAHEPGAPYPEAGP